MSGGLGYGGDIGVEVGSRGRGLQVVVVVVRGLGSGGLLKIETKES